jgi:beta-glucanase (GH16 family)
VRRPTTTALAGRAVAAIVAALALVVLPVPARAEAAPAWKLSWSTEFNGTALPTKCYSYGGPYVGGDNYWDPSEIKVSGGQLRLTMRPSVKDGKHYVAGGVSCPVVSQVYGRFEWSAKIPVGKGVDSYATLWPVTGDGEANRTLVEIVGVPGDEVMAVTNAFGSGYDDKHVDGVYTDRFHTYAIEWTPSSFRLTVDGVQKFASTKISTVKKSLQFAMVNGDPFSSLPNAATRFPAEYQIDWARAYTYGGEASPATTTPATPTGPAITPGGATAIVAPTPVTSGPLAAGPAADERTTWAPWAMGALLLFVVSTGFRLLWRRRSTVENRAGKHTYGPR